MKLSTPKPRSYLCVTSGISAPTMAWKKRGWRAIAYAEIDPFASAALNHRYRAGRPRFMPDPAEAGLDEKERKRRGAAIKAMERIEWEPSSIVNQGDFTTLRDEPWIVDAEILVGGTPCQDFSLAGLRKSLKGHRGNLTLEFIRLANAIDDLRRDAGLSPAAVLWENVPGVFTTGDNAFGAFLAGLVGADRPLDPSGAGGWTDAGVVAGPRRVAAWRVLDAQHFGLAQRRRRVFVLARGGPGAWAVADALLPLIDSMRGHPRPSRPARAGVARSLTSSLGGPSAKEQQFTFVSGDGRPLNALGGGDGDPGAGGTPGGGDRLAQAFADGTAISASAEGGEDLPHLRSAHHLTNQTPLVAVPIDPEPIPFDTTQLTHPENRSNPKAGDPSPTLARDGHPPAIAFSVKDDGGDALEDLAPTLRAMNYDGSHANGGGQLGVAFSADVSGPLLAGTHEGQQPPGTTVDTVDSLIVTSEAVAFSMRGRGGENMIEPEPGDVSPAVRTGGGGSSMPFVATAEPFAFKPSHYTRDKDGKPSDVFPALSADADKGDQDPLVLTFQERGRPEGRTIEIEDGEIAPTLTAPQGGGRSQERNILLETAVRRLTPVECERLQGFPDNFTLIPYSDARRDDQDLAETIEYLRAHGFGDNEAAVLARTPDGPRYRVLGNTMAVDVIEDLGGRIDWVLDQ